MDEFHGIGIMSGVGAIYFHKHDGVILLQIPKQKVLLRPWWSLYQYHTSTHCQQPVISSYISISIKTHTDSKSAFRLTTLLQKGVS